MKEEFNILNKGQIKMSFYNWLKKNHDQYEAQQ